jgi:hypothetical protein
VGSGLISPQRARRALSEKEFLLSDLGVLCGKKDSWVVEQNARHYSNAM